MGAILFALSILRAHFLGRRRAIIPYERLASPVFLPSFLQPEKERRLLSFPPIPEEPHVYTRRRCHCSPREMCSFLATFFKRRLACYLESRSRPGSHLFSHLGNYPRCLSLRKTEHRGFQPPLNGIVMRDSMPRYRISALFSKKRLKEIRLEGGY